MRLIAITLAFLFFIPISISAMSELPYCSVGDVGQFVIYQGNGPGSVVAFLTPDNRRDDLDILQCQIHPDTWFLVIDKPSDA